MRRFFVWFDRATDEMDIKTRIMIRQSFTLVIVILAFVGLFIGVSAGRRAADKGGVPIVEETRDVFDIDITRERERVTFSGMIDEQVMIERDNRAPERTANRETEPDFRTDEDMVLERDTLRGEETTVPQSQGEPLEPIEPQGMTPREREPEPVPSAEQTDAEVIIREEDRMVPEDETQQQDSSASAEWAPGSEDGDREQNMVPLDRNGGIVE